jgi:hypothetical protein
MTINTQALTQQTNSRQQMAMEEDTAKRTLGAMTDLVPAELVFMYSEYASVMTQPRTLVVQTRFISSVVRLQLHRFQ